MVKIQKYRENKERFKLNIKYPAEYTHKIENETSQSLSNFRALNSCANSETCKNCFIVQIRIDGGVKTSQHGIEQKNLYA